jgi:hypothetical protein
MSIKIVIDVGRQIRNPRLDRQIHHPEKGISTPSCLIQKLQFDPNLGTIREVSPGIEDDRTILDPAVVNHFYFLFSSPL